MDAGEALDGCLAAYSKKNSTGVFRVARLGATRFVFPVRARDGNGDVQDVKPVLAETVSGKGVSGTVADCAERLAAELAAARRVRIACGKMLPAVADRKVSLPDVPERTAAQTLAALSAALGNEISWRLLYEPPMARYVLQAVPRGSATAPR